MEVEPEAPPEPPGPPPSPPGASLAGLPNIREVYQDRWAQHGFDEIAALELKCGEDNTLDMYINMDNLHLRNEIARRRNLDPNDLKYWFKYGLCLLALGMLYQFRQSRVDVDQQASQEEAGEDIEVQHFGDIAAACRGLAVTVIPVIAQLGRGRDEAVT